MLEKEISVGSTAREKLPRISKTKGVATATNTIRKTATCHGLRPWRVNQDPRDLTLGMLMATMARTIPGVTGARIRGWR